jgi:hypothetical protein
MSDGSIDRTDDGVTLALTTRSGEGPALANATVHMTTEQLAALRAGQEVRTTMDYRKRELSVRGIPLMIQQIAAPLFTDPTG